MEVYSFAFLHRRRAFGNSDICCNTGGLCIFGISLVGKDGRFFFDGFDRDKTSYFLSRLIIIEKTLTPPCEQWVIVTML
jgi:hypothetical protein